MAENTLAYRYKINILYTKDNNIVTIGPDKISSMIIDYSYDTKNMPIIIMKLTLDKNLIDHMSSNKSKILILDVQKYDISNTIKIYKSFIKKEFFYFLDTNKNYNRDMDYASNTNVENQDITKIITIGLMCKDNVLNNKCLTNTIYVNSGLFDIVCDKFSNHKLLIEPFDNDKLIDNLIISPINTLSKFVSYIDNEFTLYTTKYRLFYDFDKTYLISSSGKGIPCVGEKYNSVYIYIFNVTNTNSKVEGMSENKDTSSYTIYTDASKINIQEDNSTALSYNTIIGVDTEGNTKTYKLNSDIENGTDRYAITRVSNNNLEKLNSIKNNIDSSSVTINIMKEQLDAEIFTINKEYYIKGYEDLEEYDGRYLLSSKKEIYLKETDNFQMTTVFTFKKCPSV